MHLNLLFSSSSSVTGGSWSQRKNSSNEPLDVDAESVVDVDQCRFLLKSVGHISFSRILQWLDFMNAFR